MKSVLRLTSRAAMPANFSWLLSEVAAMKDMRIKSLRCKTRKLPVEKSKDIMSTLENTLELWQ